MTASPPFDTGPAVLSWDSQAFTAVSDIAHLHTESLAPPEALRPLPPTESLALSSSPLFPVVPARHAGSLSASSPAARA